MSSSLPTLMGAGQYASLLENAMKKYGITDPLDACFFLGNMKVESQQFKVLAENLNYAADSLQKVFGKSRISEAQAWAYGRIDDKVRARTGSKKPNQVANQVAIANTVYGGEWGRINLGNFGVNDGWNYRGSGFGQTTGYANFKTVSQALFGNDILVANPGVLRTDPKIAADASAALWKYKKMSELIRDNKNLPLEKINRMVTLRWNGGTNALDERLKYTTECLAFCVA